MDRFYYKDENGVMHDLEDVCDATPGYDDNIFGTLKFDGIWMRVSKPSVKSFMWVNIKELDNRGINFFDFIKFKKLHEDTITNLILKWLDGEPETYADGTVVNTRSSVADLTELIMMKMFETEIKRLGSV